MKRFALLLLIIIVTAAAFMPITERAMEGGKSTAMELWGLPILGVASDRICWLSLGMGYGVLHVGVVGAGVVCLAVGAGGGVIFGTGQVTCGLIAIGQLGIGVVFSLAQLGTGLAGLGQLIVGLLVKGQVGLGKDGGTFLSRLREDLDKVLAFR